MSQPPLISIIITCKNAYRWLNKCLTSLKNQTNQDFEVIFVDDGSTDKSLGFVKQHFPQIKIVQNLTNVGFARANNAGASISQSKYLFLLNADTYLDSDTMANLVRYLKKNPHHHLMQLDIRYYDKSNLKGEPCIFNIDRFGYPIWSGIVGHQFYADGAALIIKRDLFIKLQGFDEAYFIYLEDLDLSWRARLVGEDVYFLNKVYVYHYGGGTSVSTISKKGKYTTSLRRRFDAQKNNLRSLIKNYSINTLLWTLPFSILLASIEGWLYLFKGNLKGFIALHKSILWNLTNLPDTLTERQRIQSSRIINDKEILKYCDKRISKVASYFFYGIPSMKT